MIRKCLIPLIFLAFFSGCAASPPKTASHDPSSDLSDKRYLVATGIGQTDPEARRMAKAEMSAIFESQIESQVGSSVKLTTGSNMGEDINKETEANINIKSNVQLQGVEIKKTWYDEKSRMYYAQAVLDKYSAREQWSDRANKLDEDIDAGFQRLETIRSPVSKLESLKVLYDQLLEQETLISRLRVIGFFDQGFAEHNAESTMGMIRDIKKQMVIYIDISGHHAKDVEATISKHLAEKGYTLAPEKRDANLIMTGTVETEPVALDSDQWKFSRAVVSLTVNDLITNRDVIKLHERVRKGHMNPAEASKRAAVSAAKKVSQGLIDSFGI
jgi:hypothetical protein